MVQLRGRGRSRVVASESDEEHADPIKSTAPSSKSSAQQTSKTPTSTPSPQVTRQRAAPKKSKAESKAPTKTIYSFFNTATLKQQDKIKEDAPLSQESVEEVIEDDISEDDAKVSVKNVKKVASVAGIKRTFATLQSSDPSTAAKQRDTAPKFIKTSTGNKAIPTQSATRAIQNKTLEQDTRPWTEKYGPQTIEEVVVHKKKVSDVRSWLEAALAGQAFKKLVVLKGPAGSGKTATIQCLAKALGFTVLEWKSPTGSDFSTGDYQSISMQFDDFINRGRVFGGLEIADASSEVVHPVEDDTCQDSSQAILVEDFPHTILRSTSALQTFRSSLLQSLAASASPHSIPRPIILIISESATMGNASATDAMTAHRLLGPEILHHPNVNVIEFNHVATTFVSKALKLVLEKHQKATSSSPYLSAEVIAKVAEIGDLRNATSTLEYLGLGNNKVRLGAAPNTKARATKSKSKVVKSAEEQQQESAALSYVTLRESTLGLFHATGRVLYNKRAATQMLPESSSPRATLAEPLPPHMNNLARNMPLDFDIATLMDEAGTDVSTFISTLHENYPLSCYSTTESADATLDALNGCLDALCDADIILPTMDMNSAANEGVRQEELAFHTAVGGVMLNLPYPVHRRPPPGRSKADAHRMFYPTGLKLWRRKEELTGLVDVLAARAQVGTLVRDTDLPTKSGRSISQPGRMIPSARLGSSQPVVESGKAIDLIGLGSGQSARYEMLVERLPYLSHILSSANRASPLLRQVDQITRYTGVGIVQDDNEDDGTPQMLGNTFQKRSTGIGMAFSRGKGSTDDLDVKGLVLSDDDIEDD